ncbi:MAG: hypothetical protein AABZ06_09340 [Bdellovibrionota bacterium]
MFNYGFIVIALFITCAATATGENTASPVPIASPSPLPITKQESVKLLREFIRTQKNGLSALKHRQNLELKELEAAQRARKKEWMVKYQGVLNDCVAEKRKKKGNREECVQEYREHRKVFQQILRDERLQRVREQDVRYKSLLADQASRFREFKEYLVKAERPPYWLWQGH